MRFLFVAGIIVIAFVCAFTLYIFFSTPPATATMTLNGSEIAKSSLTFLESMKRSDGSYDYSFECTDQSGCNKTTENYVQTGAWAVLAYGNLYQTTNQKQYLDKMNGEADDLMKLCESNQNECMWILVQMIEAYKISKNSQYLDFVKVMGDKLLANNDYNTDAMMTGIEARQFALLYELTNDQKYLNEAKVRFAQSKAAWNESVDNFNKPVYTSGSFVLYRFACWTELGEAEIARASNDRNALQNVINFFDSADIGNKYEKLDQLTAIQPCISSLLSLYEQTGNTTYYAEAKGAMQYIVTYRWDSPLPQATKYNGDGGFLFELYTGENTKTTTDTGYMISLLSQMPSEQFKIISWR